jgi:hypothetical protein
MTNPDELFSAAALTDDSEARRWGIGFVDGSIPGYALLIGEDIAGASAVFEDLRQRKILTFVTDASLRAGLQTNGQSLGWEAGAVPLDLPAALDSSCAWRKSLAARMIPSPR